MIPAAGAVPSGPDGCEVPGFENLGFARPDLGREARTGMPAVVYGPGKQPHEITGIVRSLLAGNRGPVLVTRVAPDVATAVRDAVPGGRYDEAARLLAWRPPAPTPFRVLVVSAGTADAPVAAEAVAVAAAVGLTVQWLADLGVAGLHRLLAVSDDLAAADVVICVAGMEGALPSVVGGLVGCPVIAVPTSVGYGAALGGLTPLLAVLSSCAAGLVVVNVDSGFSAAVAAHRIARAGRDR